MSVADLVPMFLGLALLLVAARLGGMLARALTLPAVVGELCAGIFLGPSLLGHFLPGVASALLPAKGNGAVFLAGFKNLACVMFMLAAGLEVNLRKASAQGGRAVTVSTAGMIFPFVLGLLVAHQAPHLLGYENHTSPWVFALFFATAMSITALPVVVKTIYDLRLQHSEVGLTVIAAAMLDDLIGWLTFGVVLQMAGANHGGFGMGASLILTTLFALFTLGPLRIFLAGRGLDGSTVFVLGLLGAAFTEWAGIHALFGAFLMGVALATAISQETRHAIDTFVGWFFAPIFFATVGLSVNFLKDFDLPVVVVVLLVACLGKICGCWSAARASGMDRRDAWGVGLGMNGRGAMEIVLGSVAYQQGLIGGRLFVALITMAAVTSTMAGVGLARLYRTSNEPLTPEAELPPA